MAAEFLASPRARVVRLNPPIGLARLFKPLPKRGARPVLDVSYRPKGGKVTLRFSAKEALGVPEQTLLLSLLELARGQHDKHGAMCVLDSSVTDPLALELWTRVTRGNPVGNSRTLRINTSWHELNRVYGEQIGGSATATRQEQLRRLCEVVVWEEETDKKHTRRQSYLVVMLSGDDERLHLALNARLASAILEDGYAQISLAERSKLSKDVAKAVHAFLSTAISPGRRLAIGVDTLLDRLWPGSAQTAPGKTHTSRGSYVRDALAALNQLDAWQVSWQKKDVAMVRRGRGSDGNMTSHNARKTSSLPRPGMAICPSKNKDIEDFDASGLFSNKR